MNARLPLALGTLAGLTLCSCFLQPTRSRVDDELMRPLSAAQLEPVQWARAEKQRADETLAAASDGVAAARSGLERARLEHQVVTDGVDRAQAARVVALRSGIVDAALEATAEYASTLLLADTTRLGVALAKRELEHAELLEELAEERVGFAGARLDLVRADALFDERLAPEDTPAVDDLRAEVYFADAEVEIANERLSAARVRLESARSAHALAVDDARRRARDKAAEEARKAELRRPPPLR